MNLIILILQVLVLFINIQIHKKLLKPPVFLALIWLVPIAVINLVGLFEEVKYEFNEYAIIFPIGCMLFSFFYLLIDKKKCILNKNNIDVKKITIFFKIFILIELFLVMYWFIDVLKYVNTNFKYNFWYTYKWGVSVEEYFDPFFIPYLRTASRIITLVMLVNYLKKIYKKDNLWFYFQLIITIILNFLGQGRGGIFSLIIPMLVIYLLVNNDSKRRKGIIIALGSVTLIAIFFIYARMKDPYTVNADKSPFLSFENYLCGGVISLCEWLNGPHQYAYGAYTFRFFNALLNRIGFDVEVVSMVEDYVENIHGNVGNVYTIYKWYANDFGIIYALFIQGMLGVVYGLISNKLRRNNNIFWLVIYSTMFYPLFMQFFNDQYLSNFSIWVQIVFWAWLFSKCGIFMTDIKQKNNAYIGIKDNINKMYIF